VRSLVVLSVLTVAGAARADEPLPIEAALRGGVTSVHHDTFYGDQSDRGWLVDAEAGVRCLPNLSLLVHFSRSRVANPAEDQFNDAGDTVHDSHVRISELGIRLRANGDNFYGGVGLGYQWSQFSYVLDQTIESGYPPFFGTVENTETGLLGEVHAGYRTPRLPRCHCSLDLFVAADYGGSWLGSATIALRGAIGVAVW
jgi:hypothetical protein